MHRFHRWRDVLLATPDEASVRRVVGEYAGTLDPSVVSALPEDCQRALKEPDIQAAAVALLHCEMRFQGSDEVRALLHEIAHTYAAASLRLTALNRGPIPAAD